MSPNFTILNEILIHCDYYPGHSSKYLLFDRCLIRGRHCLLVGAPMYPCFYHSPLVLLLLFLFSILYHVSLSLSGFCHCPVVYNLLSQSNTHYSKRIILLHFTSVIGKFSFGFYVLLYVYIFVLLLSCTLCNKNKCCIVKNWNK